MRVPQALRLAIITDTFPPQINGVAGTLARLMDAVERRGGCVHIEAPATPATPPDPRVHRSGSIPFWAYPQLRIACPSHRAMVRRLRAFGPTLIHVATPFGIGWAGRSAAHRLGIPLVTSYHTAFASYLTYYGFDALAPASWRFLRWFHNGGRRTFAPSASIADDLRSRGFTGVGVWGRGVDVSHFSPDRRSEARRLALGASPETVVFAYVGRLAPEKRIDLVLDAFGLLRARAPRDLALWVVGDGPDADRLRARAPKGTQFLGAHRGADLAELYASADGLAFPSSTETFGNVVLEAMASGLAVVAPDVGPTLELTPLGSALTFRAGSAAALAYELERLVIDPVLRRSLGAAARTAAIARTWDRVWDGLFADYAGAIDAGSPPAVQGVARATRSSAISARDPMIPGASS
jgi:phosphatidylinositol alpha 1,6-mannosyltransferase